ncbi:PIR protein [Plasmodium vivax]|nr:PIR protein [Plasmodium vivax]
MSGQTSEPKYFNDKSYNELKRKFSSYKNIKKDDNFTNNFIESKKNEYTNRPFPEITIRYLREHLLNGSVHYSYRNDDICRYINFWLNTEIRQPNNLKYGSNFDLFKEFALKLSKEERGNETIACKNIINYIDPDTYDKMETIYKLYELYDDLKTNPDVYKRCDAFGYIIANYNSASLKYDNEDGKDYKLIEKLLDLKKLTVESELPPHSKCGHRILQFKKPDKYLKRLEEEAIRKREKEEEELQRQKQAEALQRQKQQEELEKQNSQQGEKLDTNEVLSNGENLLSVVLTQKNERGQSFSAESPGVEGYIERQGFSGLSFSSEQQEQMEGRHSEFKDQSMDTRATSGFTGSITDTISGFIKEVEPGPVLGVSGGMGALFLLFKYTPVGTFFRGRRGRTYGIPSGFNGPLPGEFPGYHDYLGANIGYGPMNPLAE